MPERIAIASGELRLAIPAYNEADGIGEFLRELDAALVGWDGPVHFHVVDDASTDDTRLTLEAVREDLGATLHAATNEQNVGHGPSLLRAYQLAADSGADYVLHVDGDGQFDGRECLDLAQALTQAGADVAAGCRTNRQDPWFRKALSRSLRLYLLVAFGVRSRDPNCPFRLYRREALTGMLARVPQDAAVPNIYLTILAARRGVRVVDVPVAHRVRRGNSAQGTTWGRRASPLLIPRRLLALVGRALVETIRFRRSIRAARAQLS